uniref:Endonuclease/exonuclease/phosphatase domain-containing protein n=1 Tax=Biomphalaria glabrata TaxID=6526 RepID=A0A2C9KMW7_BIOGL
MYRTILYTDIDMQEILLWRGGTKYTIKNFYCPPSSTAEIDLQLPHYTRTMIAGDLNAHTPSLGYPHYNKRGKEIEDVTNASNLQLLQNKTSPPTFLHRAHNTTSRPDLTIISTDITDSSKITVLEDIGSDQRPILLNIGTP